MTTNIDFAIWCSRKCLHLWDAPDVVKEWLEDPKPETAWAAADAAKAAWPADGDAVAARGSTGSAGAVAFAVSIAAKDAAEAEWSAARSAEWSAGALNTTVTDLRLEYVKAWSDEELGKAEDDWIEVATVEILDRM